MKKFMFMKEALLLCVLFIGFYACSSDDNDDNGGIDPKGKKISKIVNEYDDMIRTETFKYTNAKLTKYTASYKDDDDMENDLTITYNGNQVIMKGILDGEESVLTYTLTNGLATTCQIIYNEDKTTTNCTFQYTDGYLIGMTSTNPENYKETYVFSIDGDNISKLKSTQQYQNQKDESTYSFTYSIDINKGKIINPFFGDILFDHVAASYAGILGKSTKNLAKYVEIKEDTRTINDKCDYTLDNDGYVKTATTKENKFTYTFE